MTGDEFERGLRAVLAARARQAPAGDDLADRILGSIDASGPGRASRWIGWVLPLAAAAAVAVVAVALALHGVPGRRTSPLHSVAAPSVVPTEATGPTAVHSTAPHRTTATSPAAASTSTSSSPAVAPVLHGVTVLDLTFVSADSGWALASADCLSGPGRCTAVLRTTDGHTWHGVPGAVFNVAGVASCADPCVTSLRFATDQVGYAYGPSALFLTRDGGAHWQRQSGGADALETAGGVVLRASLGRCTTTCPMTLWRSAIGSSSWSTVALPGAPVRGSSAWLALGARRDYLLVSSGAAGPAPTLYASADRGRTWGAGTELKNPGVLLGPESLAAGPQGAVVFCRETQTGIGRLVLTDADGAPQQIRSVPFGNRGAVASSPSGVLTAAGDGVVRSTDAGRTWHDLPGIGPATFVGFESATVGRIVADGGRAVYTTHDAGVTWQPVYLP